MNRKQYTRVKKIIIIFIFIVVPSACHAETEKLYYALVKNFNKYIEYEYQTIKNMELKYDEEITAKYRPACQGENTKYFFRGANNKIYMLKEENKPRVLSEVITYRIFKLYGEDLMPTFEATVDVKGEKIYGTLIEFNEKARTLKWGDLFSVSSKAINSIIHQDLLDYLAISGDDEIVVLDKENKIVDYFSIDHDAMLADYEDSYEFTPEYFALWFIYHNNKQCFDPVEGIYFAKLISETPAILLEKIINAPFVNGGQYNKKGDEKILNIFQASEYLDLDYEEVKRLIINGKLPAFKKSGEWYIREEELLNWYLQELPRSIVKKSKTLLATYIASLREHFDYTIPDLEAINLKPRLTELNMKFKMLLKKRGGK